MMYNYERFVNLLINNYTSPVLIYAGEYDELCGPAQVNPWIRSLETPANFWDQDRKIYYVPNATVEETNAVFTGGYYRNSDVFAYLTVPKAGHFVPNSHNNYPVSFQFFSDYLNFQNLECYGHPTGI